MNSSTDFGMTITLPKSSQPATLDDLSFGEAENDTVVVPITKMARLKWFNGAATDQHTLAFGWHVESQINPLIDETLQGMGMKRYIVEHRTADKDGNTQKEYWHLHPCSLIVVAEGVLTPFQMRNTENRTGIAYARVIDRDEDGSPKRYPDGQRNIITRKVLKLRAFVHEMVEHGYNDWFALTLVGNIVDSMLDALSRQFDVLKAFQGYTGRNAPFYGFSLPLVPASTRKMVGPEKSQSPIYPMLAALPATIDQAYLLKHGTSRALVEHIRETLLGETIIWSVQESSRMAIGAPHDEKALLAEPLSSPESEQKGDQGKNPPRHTPSPRAEVNTADPVVKKAQIDWIINQYCGGNKGVLQAILEAFSAQSGEQFDSVTQLRKSHFDALVAYKREAEASAGTASTQG